MMNLSTRKIRLILFSIILGVIYWVIESAIMAYFFHESGFIKQLFTPSMHEIWPRILVFAFLISFAYYIDFFLVKPVNIQNLPDPKLQQETLEASHSFHQSVIDGVAVPIMVIGTDYQVKLMNKAARNFSSKDNKIYISESTKCYQISHQCETPCNGIEHPCPLDLVCKSGQMITLVHRHYQADGEWRLVEVTASPLRARSGTIQGIIESIHDITESQKAEEAKQQYAERLRALATQLTEVAEIERSRLARELHDQVGQNLTAIGINLNLIRSYIPEDVAAQVLFHFEDSLSLVDQTTQRIRDLTADLRPPLLDEYGLLAALEWYSEYFSRRTHITMSIIGKEPEPRLPTRVENALFSIAQEALTNVAKHAHATTTTVTVEEDRNLIRLIVADNGVGFQQGQQAKFDGSRGWGFITMTERAESVGGHCHIESSPNQGTRVIVELTR